MTIYYNNKLITCNNCYKNNNFEGKIITAEPFFFESEQMFMKMVEKYDVILFPKEREEEVLTKIQSILKPITAAGGVVKNNLGQTLMIHRLGKWDLPKGKLEKGENIEDCALREVEEECGIQNLTLLSHRTNSYHIYELKGKYIIKTTVWYNMLYDGNETLIPQTEEDITGVEWVDSDKISEKLENSYLTIVDTLKEI